MNYLNEIKKAKELLYDCKYDLCSMQCGKIIERALKDKLKSFMNNPDANVSRIINQHLRSCKKESIKYLMLGELLRLYERPDIFRKFSREFSLISLKRIVFIRNRYIHVESDDHNEEAEADACIMYGNTLKLLQCFGFTQQIESPQEEKTQTDVVKSKSNGAIRKEAREIGVPLPPKGKLLPSIDVCENKASGEYFIYIDSTERNKARFVASDGEIRTLRLDQDLFGPIENKKEDYLLSRNLIKEKQLRRYHEYMNRYPERDERRGRTTIGGRIQSAIYTYRVHNAEAKMVIKNDLYVVLKGSTAVVTVRKSIPQNAILRREELIRSGKIVLNSYANLYQFQEDIEFQSPSLASCIISGSSTNGPKSFNIK